MDEGREEDWVPDEDYDALNDETFGDEGEGKGIRKVEGGMMSF